MGFFQSAYTKHIIHPESGLNLPFFALSWPMSLHLVLESTFDIAYFLFIAQCFLQCPTTRKSVCCAERALRTQQRTCMLHEAIAYFIKT